MLHKVSVVRYEEGFMVIKEGGDEPFDGVGVPLSYLVRSCCSTKKDAIRKVWEFLGESDPSDE